MRGSLLCLACLVMLTVPTALAEGDGSQRFYVTDVNNGSGDACSDGGNAYEGSNEAPDEGKAYAGTSAIGVACGFTVRYTTTEDYQLRGDVDIEFWSNCDAGATIEQDYRLIIGETTIADVRGGSIGPCGATETPIKGGGTHSSDDLFVPAGTDVLMRFALFSGPEPGTGPVRNAYITVGGDMPSGFAVDGWGIPFVATPDSATVFENLTGAATELSFDNATFDDYVFNFTNGLENVTVSFAWNATSGHINATLADGDGTELLNQTFEGNGTFEEILEGVAPGNWTLSLDHHNFTGESSFTLSPYEAPMSNATVTGNATGNETLAGGADGEEAPALPFVLATLALAAVARWRRR